MIYNMNSIYIYNIPEKPELKKVYLLKIFKNHVIKVFLKLV